MRSMFYLNISFPNTYKSDIPPERLLLESTYCAVTIIPAIKLAFCM